MVHQLNDVSRPVQYRTDSQMEIKTPGIRRPLPVYPPPQVQQPQIIPAFQSPMMAAPPCFIHLGNPTPSFIS